MIQHQSCPKQNLTLSQQRKEQLASLLTLLSLALRVPAWWKLTASQGRDEHCCGLLAASWAMREWLQYRPQQICC